ncbi:collagen alpha-1(XII) chain [Biomphalaria pfeifferi]|uniref:Collagen alpha-1(XII) chain n=1 Tax=Biomphalaria pfeifferi TaxID=112525 RepID=A0AAD8EYQ8_BIOPF|nr:collagen alpha-1(XII) chain [Biomphalaria pfeifferi]
MFPFKIFVFISVLTLTTVNGLINCPVCSNPFDPTSCTGVQHCSNANHDICELHIHLAEANRLSYSCQTSNQCINRESHPCSINTNEMCTYCCTGPHACEVERRNLFSTIFTTRHPTNAPNVHSTQPHTTVSKCIVCDTEPCDVSGLPYLSPIQCSHTHPYCVSKYVQDAHGHKVHKGCATEEFCRTYWWDLTSQNTQCMSTSFPNLPSLDCTFCCHGDGCNKPNRPAHNTLVQF